MNNIIKDNEKNNNSYLIIVIFIIIFSFFIFAAGILWNGILHNVIHTNQEWNKIIENNEINWLKDNSWATKEDFIIQNWKIKYGYINIQEYKIMFNNSIGSLILICVSSSFCFISLLTVIIIKIIKRKSNL